MADITRRPTRRQREQRAYQLTLATGAGALASVTSVVLSIVGLVGGGVVVLLVLLTVVLGLLLRRTLKP
jgi:uncharacterized membrane protein YgaE (UPF0421/DUF939 family)